MHDAHLTRLILAIEPDRGKASQLKSIARQVGAELQLVDSVDGALAAIGERMPDLILTPALLSAREDSTLAGRLRGLGEAAAHIQTLTIPILEDAQPGAAMFGALRRDRIRDRIFAAGPDACGTDTFAQQVSVYLERATEGRHRHMPPSTAGPLQAVGGAAAEPATHTMKVVTPPAQLPPPADASEFLAGSDLDAFLSEDMLEPTEGPVPGTEAVTTVDLRDIQLAIDEAEAISVALSDFVSENLARVIAETPAERPAAQPDTWQFFDPAEPRFAALLARLDEISTA